MGSSLYSISLEKGTYIDVRNIYQYRDEIYSRLTSCSSPIKLQKISPITLFLREIAHDCIELPFILTEMVIP